jgi:hypothetical protein
MQLLTRASYRFISTDALVSSGLTYRLAFNETLLLFRGSHIRRPLLRCLGIRFPAFVELFGHEFGEDGFSTILQGLNQRGGHIAG